MFNIFSKNDRTELYYKRQRFKKGFAICDCYALSYWLTSTLPKMILTLRDMKNGAPQLPFKEYNTLPEDWKNIELQKLKKLEEQQGYTYDPNSIFTKWYILLTRMAYCLQEADEDKPMYNPYKQEYDKQFWTHYTPHKKLTDKEKEIQQNYYKVEDENDLYKSRMKDEALDLIKEYFYNLWD